MMNFLVCEVSMVEDDVMDRMPERISDPRIGSDCSESLDSFGYRHGFGYHVLLIYSYFFGCYILFELVIVVC